MITSSIDVWLQEDFMITCLSNPEWLKPQIDLLLFLQNIRICHSEIIDTFFLSITVFGEFWLPTVICAVTYWCFDFRAGIYLFSLESINIFIAHFLKMLACVYRPWILDDKIHPSALAVPYAKGYSFPSGHSAMSSSVLGGFAYILRKKKILFIILVTLILLIMFSRLWLGVHTLQDIFGGLFIGLTLIFAVNKIINWAENNRNRYLYLIGIINFTAALALIYICYFNHCRIDYINGEILVNPIKSIYTTCVVYGYSLGLINGCFLCRKFFPFNPKDGSPKHRILRGTIGVSLIIILIKYVLRFVVMNTFDFKISLLITFMAGISITLIYPLIFTYFEKIQKTQQTQ